MGGAQTIPYKKSGEALNQMKNLLQMSNQMVKQFLSEREYFRNQYNEKILNNEFESVKCDLEQINNYYKKNESYLIKKMGKLILKSYIELISNKVIESIQFLELVNQVIERISASKKLLSNDPVESQIQKYREELSQNIQIFESFLFQQIDYEQLFKNVKIQNKQQQNEIQEYPFDPSQTISLTTMATNYNA